MSELTKVLTIEEKEAVFNEVFKQKCRSIPPECVRWVDSLCSIRVLDCDGVLPGVIDIQSAEKTELARFADLCKRLEKMFTELGEIAKSNRAQACKQIGKILEEDEEGDFELTDSEGRTKARFLRSEDFIVSVKDQQKLIGWLFLNGFGEAVQSYYIHHKTLNGILKDYLKQGGALPDVKIVKCHPDTIAKITKVYDLEGIWDGSIQIQTSTTEVEIGREKASLDVKEGDSVIDETVNVDW